MRVLIVEDEPVVARRLGRLLGTILGNAAQCIDVSPGLDQARDRMRRTRYDVLFLDLNLRGRDGFELLAGAVAGAHQTIVVSANTDRALEAFEYGVIDFVPKPFGRERLEKSLARLEAPRAPPARPARFLAFRHGNRVEVMEVDRVRAIHGADNYAEVEMMDGRRLLHGKTLESLEQLLPEHFERVHRSHIVNLRCVRNVRALPGSRYIAELDNGRSIPVGRTRVKSLRRRLA